MSTIAELEAKVGRTFIAIPMIAFGIQHIFYAEFVTRLVPKFQAWVAGGSILAIAFGVYLISSGAAILLANKNRLPALLLGAMILSSFTVLYLPLVFADPTNASLWTNAGKALAISGGCFLAAGTLRTGIHDPEFLGGIAAINRALGKFIPMGPYFLAAFLTFCGIEHFIYVGFVVTLIPPSIPEPLFWTYFTGAALVAGGVGMSIPPTARLAAQLSAIMIFLWVLTLHIPRAFANLHNSNETTAVFEAIAVTGTALLVSARISERELAHEIISSPVDSPSLATKEPANG